MDSAYRVRMARRRAGLSQAQLARAVGVQRSAAGHWETVGGKNPSVGHLRTIALATGVQFEWLATGRGPIHASAESELEAVSAVAGVLLDDALEIRMVNAFRSMPARAKMALVELIESTERHAGRSRLSRGK